VICNGQEASYSWPIGKIGTPPLIRLTCIGDLFPLLVQWWQVFFAAISRLASRYQLFAEGALLNRIRKINISGMQMKDL
jgi:hypothetical protein